jgi:hypothetical protein
LNFYLNCIRDVDRSVELVLDALVASGQADRVKVRLPNLLMALGTFFGLWLLVQQLVGLEGIADTLKTATWGWAVLTIVATQLTNVTEALAISGTLPVAVPIGPLAMLRIALAFHGSHRRDDRQHCDDHPVQPASRARRPDGSELWGDLQRLGLHRPIGDPHRILRCLPT